MDRVWHAANWEAYPGFFWSVFVVVPVALVVGYVAVGVIWRRMKRATRGLPKMQEVHEAIHRGARAYLFQEARYLGIALAVLVVPIALTGMNLHPVAAVGMAFTALIVVLGAASSFLAGYMGMRTAMLANVRVVMAVKDETPSEGFKLGYLAGTVTGISNITNFILGIWVLLLVTDMNIYLMVSYDFGASVTALFAQVGGGIFTKSADMGADILGKLDLGIPEDDPRNAAVIADNVGDNVGDCAGRGADFFESASFEAVGGLILGMAVFTLVGNPVFIILDMVYIATGIYSSLICIRLLNRPLRDDPARVVWVTFLAAMGLNAGIDLVFTLLFLGPSGLFLFLAGFMGLVSSIFTVLLTSASSS